MRPDLVGGEILARNAVLNFLGQGWLLALGLVSAPILVHRLGTAAYGILALASVITGYLGVLDLGISRANVKFLSEALAQGERLRVRHIMSTAAASQLLLGTLGAAILAAGGPFFVDRILGVTAPLASEARLAIIVMAFGLPLILVGGVYEGTLMALQRFDLIALVRTASGTIRAALAIALVLGGMGILGAVAAVIVAQAVHVALILAATLRLFPDAVGFKLNRGMLRSMVRFGGWVTVSSLVGPLLVYLDRFLIGALLSVHAVSYYTIPYDAVTKLWIIPYAIVPTVFPVFAALAARAGDRSRLTSLYSSATKFTFVVMAPIVVVLLAYGPQLLRLWIGEEIAAAGSQALRILALGVMINSLAQIPFGIIQASGRPDLTAKFHLIELPLHVALCLWLIPTFGVSGAATAWSLRVLVDGVLLVVAAGRILHHSPAGLLRDALTKSGGVVLVLMAVTAGVWEVGQGLREAFLMLVALTGYALAVWRFALTPHERTPLVAWVSRLKPVSGAPSS